MTDPFATEVARIRDEVETLRQYGVERRAVAVERAVDRLERAHRDYLEEELPTTEAAAWSRYEKGTLQDLARTGGIPAAKVGGEWRFRRCDLPRKPPKRPALAPVEELADRLHASRR